MPFGTANPLALTMDGDHQVQASFEKQNVLLSLTATTGGTRERHASWPLLPVRLYGRPDRDC